MNLTVASLPHLLTFGEHVIVACSITSVFLSMIERWANQWFPKSKFVVVLAAANDLISRFGALNLRDVIAPKQWDGTDRREEAASGAAAGK